MSPERKLDPARPRRSLITRVYSMDHQHNKPRLVSLPAEEAVLWCYASDVGIPDHPERFEHLVSYMDGWWICGPYRARKDTV